MLVSAVTSAVLTAIHPGSCVCAGVQRYPLSTSCIPFSIVASNKEVQARPKRRFEARRRRIFTEWRTKCGSQSAPWLLRGAFGL